MPLNYILKISLQWSAFIFLFIAVLPLQAPEKIIKLNIYQGKSLFDILRHGACVKSSYKEFYKKIWTHLLHVNSSPESFFVDIGWQSGVMYEVVSKSRS